MSKMSKKSAEKKVEVSAKELYIKERQSDMKACNDEIVASLQKYRMKLEIKQIIDLTPLD